MANPTHRTPGRMAEATLWAVTIVAAGGLAWTATTPAAAAGFGVHVDRLTATLALLVAIVGAVTLRFARRYLLGEAGQARYLRWHFTAVISAMVLMLAGDLVLLWAAWTSTSVALHKLLTYYADWQEAWPPAEKKFVISRLGDIALIAAIVIVAVTYGTTDLATVTAATMAVPNALSTHVVAMLVVIAALTKSAQFPFHSWLPETMEAPTPVSALMHAGIINAGGALVLKFAPIVAAAPTALAILIGVGTVTAILGMLSMWAQTNVKRTLAWSTVSQMGFMMIQLGLGAFPVAVLHIVGHGFYKAWSFLACGWVPPAATRTPAPPARHLALVTVGTAVAGAVIVASAQIAGVDVLHHPGEATLLAILAMAIGQAWPLVLSPVTVAGLASACGLTVVTAVCAVALQQAAVAFYSPVFVLPVSRSEPLGWALGGVVVTATVLLIIAHAMLPTLSRSGTGRALRVHALHGFYCGAVADRVVRAIHAFTRPQHTTSGAQARA